jgi:mono/diheme cytochrome c family protein
LLVIACASSACASSAHTLKGGGVSPLNVRALDWNPGHVDVGKVIAVADAGNDVVVFSENAATILSGGALGAVDRAIASWSSASAIPAADGSGMWIVGVDDKGRVLRLRNKSRFVDVSDRYDLASSKVARAFGLGGELVSFDLGDALAVADGVTVKLLAIPSKRSASSMSAGGGGHVAFATDVITLVDVVTKSTRTFNVPGASQGRGFIAVNATGKLFVATSSAVYGEDATGQLTLRFESALGGGVHGLAASGARVWFAAGSELGLIDEEHVRETSGAKLAKDAALVGSSSGDVWAIADGALQRFAAEDAGPSWQATIGPVYQRACTPCHQADGESGVDLSSEAQWVAARERIKMRVLVRKTMPPVGHALVDADRAAIAAWVGGVAGVAGR